MAKGDVIKLEKIQPMARCYAPRGYVHTHHVTRNGRNVGKAYTATEKSVARYYVIIEPSFMFPASRNPETAQDWRRNHTARAATLADLLHALAGMEW